MAKNKAPASPKEETPASAGYPVLARRYRPQDFSQLIGQGQVSQALANASRAGLSLAQGLDSVSAETPQPLAVDVTSASAGDLRLKPGDEVTAAWKAAATRLLPL